MRERFGDLAYARVDLVRGADGPQLLELELTEPSLFFAQAPGSAERFAAAIRSRLADAPRSRFPTCNQRRRTRRHPYLSSGPLACAAVLAARR